MRVESKRRERNSNYDQCLLQKKGSWLCAGEAEDSYANLSARTFWVNLFRYSRVTTVTCRILERTHSSWSGETLSSSSQPRHCSYDSNHPNRRRRIIHGSVRDRVRLGEVESDRCEEEKEQTENIKRDRDGKRKGKGTGQMGFVAREIAEETTC